MKKIISKIVGLIKKPEVVKKYKIDIIIKKKDRSGVVFSSSSFDRLIKPFEYKAYRNFWKWFHLRESKQYTINSENESHISATTFLRSEISEIIFKSYEEINEDKK